MSTERPIVVGVDGSAGAQAAVQWAVEEAGSRQAAVRLICAYRLMPGFYQAPGMYADYPADIERIRQHAATVISNAVADAERAAPGVLVTGDTVDGAPAPALVEASEAASLLVLGSRQRSALGATVLGSVSAAAAARASCPAIVLRGPAGLAGEQAEVVVGVDGSPASQALLEFAFDHASRRRAPLRAVLCWHPDVFAEMLWRPEPPAPTRTEAWLAEAIAGWQEKYPDVDVRSGVVREHPAVGLVSESATARLLVVGNRGRHALAGTLLGSVSQAVLHSATCPVAVVPTQSL
ncbi:universal stress protein [Jatrophihabitans sp.]|uniref:universal stress protein n=1 Tax=Jatrophihabitans sp. TaxID=1932789 RepID=UPI002C7179E2|nr:universal stress protein [Jatrophihabitans sp.]